MSVDPNDSACSVRVDVLAAKAAAKAARDVADKTKRDAIAAGPARRRPEPAAVAAPVIDSSAPAAEPAEEAVSEPAASPQPSEVAVPKSRGKAKA